MAPVANHFLIGNMGGELAPDTVDTTAVNVRKRWRHVQELIRTTQVVSTHGEYQSGRRGSSY